MYNDIIRELLSIHFGVQTDSLSLGCDTRPRANTYYYVLDNIAEVLSVRNLLESAHSSYGVDKIPELKQRITYSPYTDKEIPQCACYSEYHGNWYVRIYPIEGVRYHRTYRKQIAATLILGKNPIVSLSEVAKDSFFGYWQMPSFRNRLYPPKKRIGFSYWTNKNLKTNPRFKSFTSDLFYRIGEKEKKDILVDVSKTIEKTGCFLPEISYSDLINYQNTEDLMRGISTERLPNDINLENLGLNTSYLISALLPDVDEQDLPVLFSLNEEKTAGIVSLKSFYDGVRTETILPKYYIKRIIGWDSDYESDAFMLLVEEYAQMSSNLHEKVRLTLSEEGLERATRNLHVRCKYEKIDLF